MAQPMAPDADALIAAEKVRAAALVAADKEATAGLLAEEFTYTHSTGRVDTRDSYLAAFGTNYRFLTVEQSDVSVRQYGDAAVLAGNLDTLLVPKHGEQRLSRLRFMSVWARQDGAWKLIAFQNTTRAGA